MRERLLLKETYDELINIAGDTPLKKWENIFKYADVYFDYDYDDKPDFNPWIPKELVPEIYLKDEDEFISLTELIVNIGNEFGISDYEDGHDKEGKEAIYSRILDVLYNKVYPLFTEEWLDKAIEFSA